MTPTAYQSAAAAAPPAAPPPAPGPCTKISRCGLQTRPQVDPLSAPSLAVALPITPVAPAGSVDAYLNAHGVSLLPVSSPHPEAPMKSLHRPDLYAWSAFDEARDVDFNSVAWVRPNADGGGHGAGNVLIDPLPLSAHDEQHLEQLGGVAWVVITNREHVRDAARIAARFGARIAGPAAERETLPVPGNRWLGDGDELVPGLRTLELHGSKSPGELALLLDETTLITGDLVRAHRGGQLMLLPDGKLADKGKAIASLRRLSDLPRVEAVLVGDGWSVFRDGRLLLGELLARLG